jgi:hypothetical protein
MAFGSARAAFLAASTSPAEPDDSHGLDSVLKLAERLSAPAAVTKRLTELKAATDAARAVSHQAQADKAAADKYASDVRRQVDAEVAERRRSLPTKSAGPRPEKNSWMRESKSLMRRSGN